MSPTGIKAYLALLLIRALPLATADDYFVATTGSDCAAGTAEHPFRTVQKGIDVVSRSTARHGFEGVELVANWLSGGYPASVDADSVQALRRHYGAWIKCKRAIDQAWGA
jgi:hypothetical protein